MACANRAASCSICGPTPGCASSCGTLRWKRSSSGCTPSSANSGANAARMATRCASSSASKPAAGSSPAKPRARARARSSAAILGQAVGLPLADHLQPVLGAAEERVGAAQVVRHRAPAARRPGRARSAPRCVERSRTSRMRPPCRSCSAWATNSTSRMPPAPTLTLNVPPERSGLVLDALLHGADRGDAGVVHRRAVDHRVDGADDAPAEARDRRRPAAPS